MDALNVGEIVTVVGCSDGTSEAVDFTVGFVVGLNDGDNIVGPLMGVMVSTIDGTIEGTLEEPLGAILTMLRDGGLEIEGALVLAKVGTEVEIVEGLIIVIVSEGVLVGKYVSE